MINTSVLFHDSLICFKYLRCWTKLSKLIHIKLMRFIIFVNEAWSTLLYNILQFNFQIWFLILWLFQKVHVESNFSTWLKLLVKFSMKSWFNIIFNHHDIFQFLSGSIILEIILELILVEVSLFIITARKYCLLPYI